MSQELEKCPNCGKTILENKGCYYCEDKEGCGFKIFKTICGVNITPEIFNKIVLRKDSGVFDMKSNKGNSFKAKIVLNKESLGTELNFVKTEDKVIGKCPKCKNDIILKEGLYGAYYKCTDCNFKISGVIAGTDITEDIAQMLLENKTTNPIKFKSKENKTFTAKLVLNENNEISFNFDK